MNRLNKNAKLMNHLAWDLFLNKIFFFYSFEVFVG